MSRPDRRPMTPLLLRVTVLVLLLGQARAGEARVLKDLVDLPQAVEFVLVEGGNAIGDGDWAYETAGDPLRIDPQARKVLDRLAEVPLREPSAPFIGHLARIALRDANGAPLCVLSIINHNCAFSVSAARRGADGTVVVTGASWEGTSPELARWAYAMLRKHRPEHVKALQEFYRKMNQGSLEDLLFGKRKAEPGDGG